MSLRRFSLIVVCAVVALVFAPPAHADKIDDLAGQLRGSSNYKVRLSAALALTRLRNERGIRPLLGALRDREKSVRAVAAAGLGKLVTAKTKQAVTERALSALKRLSSDDDKFVRRQAAKAIEAIKRAQSSSKDDPVVGKKGNIFVDIGAMGDKTGGNGALRDLMRETISATLTKKAPQMSHGKTPSRAALKKMKAFHVDGTLVELTVESSGRSSQIGCKVSMLIATYPKKSMFGFLNGGAQVNTGSSQSAIESSISVNMNATVPVGARSTGLS